MIWKKKVYIYHRFIKYSKHPFLSLSSWLRKFCAHNLFTVPCRGREKLYKYEASGDNGELTPIPNLIFMFHSAQISLYEKLSGNGLSSHPQDFDSVVVGKEVEFIAKLFRGIFE